MNFHIISHTHWDREWYKTFETYRVKLVKVVDNLMDLLESNQEYESFMLDGQLIVLEDYLVIKPENRERLKKLIRKGRIVVGPWYIQPDEFIPSGESLIRNLLIGLQIGDEFGHVMEIGYLPDSFGQTAQLPQVLKGCGIDHAVIWRGLSDEDLTKKEFVWQGLDDSQVIGHYLPLGYENAKWLSTDLEESKKVIQTNTDAHLNFTDSDQILLLCGYDQREANPDLPEIIKTLNKTYASEEYTFSFSTLDEYVKSIEEQDLNLDVLRGEFRKGKHMRIHASIGSTRMDIKKRNHDLEVLFEKYVEPMSAIAVLFGTKYENALINHGWKKILQNQAHDSIGNVCTDITHNEMMTRYERAEQSGKALYDDSVESILSGISGVENDELTLVVFNTLLQDRKSMVKTELVLEDMDFEIINDAGQIIDHQIVSTADVDLNDGCIESHFVGKNEAQKLKRVQLLFEAEVLGFGYTAYTKRKKSHESTIIKTRLFNSNTLENDFICVEINQNGSLDIYDKVTGELYKNQCIIEESGNAGDEYDYSPPMNDEIVLSTEKEAQIDAISNSEIMAEIRITHLIECPVDTTTTRRTSEKGLTKVELYVKMFNSQSRLEFRANIDNRVNNHRVRVLFDPQIEGTHHFADQQFGMMKRENFFENADRWLREGWQEKYYPLYNVHKYVSMYGNTRSLQVLNQGLPQYEILERKPHKIALTLLCTTDFMGKQDLVNRPGRRSGLHIATPGSKMLGVFEAKFALEFGVLKYNMGIKSEDYVYPLECHSTKKCVLKQTQQYMRVQNKEIGTSAIKISENGELLVVRFYNSVDESLKEVNIQFDHTRFTEPRLLDLRERSIEDTRLSEKESGVLSIDGIGSNEIMTIGFKLKSELFDEF